MTNLLFLNHKKKSYPRIDMIFLDMMIYNFTSYIPHHTFYLYYDIWRTGRKLIMKPRHLIT